MQMASNMENCNFIRRTKNQMNHLFETPDSIANIVEQARNQDPSLRFLPQPKFEERICSLSRWKQADIPKKKRYCRRWFDGSRWFEKDYRRWFCTTRS